MYLCNVQNSIFSSAHRIKAFPIAPAITEIKYFLLLTKGNNVKNNKLNIIAQLTYYVNQKVKKLTLPDFNTHIQQRTFKEGTKCNPTECYVHAYLGISFRRYKEI